MSANYSEASNTAEATNGATGPSPGTSPYATGGGGVTFERKVAAQYLAHLLVGDAAPGLGDDRHVISVAFQQAPEFPVDDLVIGAGRSDELEPSLLLSVGVRRSPNLVQSDQPTRKLISDYISALIEASDDGPEHRLALVVAGPKQHAQQLGTLADLASAQMDATGFFNLVETPNSFNSGIRSRLNHLERLVGHALRDLGVAEPSKEQIRQRTWQLLTKLTVLMPRIESPDETDWATVGNSLVSVARVQGLEGALLLRDRLLVLASEYSPKAARVDLIMLRRDAHELLSYESRRHGRGWQVLGHIHDQALAAVRDEIAVADGRRRLRIDRSSIAAELAVISSESSALVVSGESGVGKSALTVQSLTALGEDATHEMQVLCINLRHIHKLTMDFEAGLGGRLSTLLGELSAPHRVLIIDGADAVAEGMEDVFRYLVDAAIESDLKVAAVTTNDNVQIVRDVLNDRFGANVSDFTVPPLSDPELRQIVDAFPELGNIYGNARSRELLRRLVVVDLLVRGGVTGVPLSDSGAMLEIWNGLVRKHESADRGGPEAREIALLRLADLELNGGDRLGVISSIDTAVLVGLRQDGLLHTSDENPFMIGPDFAHDEVRRYAVARLLLSGNNPAAKLLDSGVPRWALSAARLAGTTLLEQPERANTPLPGRFNKLQSSFDALVEAGHGARWGDVAGEALLSMSDASAVLRDAWPDLKGSDAGGIRRLVRLVDQRLRDDNGLINPISIEPIIWLMLEESEPWRAGGYASNLLKDWLRGLVAARTPTGHLSRVRLRERLMEAYAESDLRLEERVRAQAAPGTDNDGGTAHQIGQTQPEWFVSQLGYGLPLIRERPEIPSICRDRDYLELLALLGPDLGDEGEVVLKRIADDEPSRLAPALEAPLADTALSQYRQGLLAQLAEAYYLDEDGMGYHFDDDGIRGHDPWYGGGLGPLHAWYLGLFAVLFQTDPRGGVAVLNRLLNHAALVRARTLARLYGMQTGKQDLDISRYENELNVFGAQRICIGDEQVWYWYRGTGVGPSPCISALQALERACDQFIEQGVSINKLVSVLLDGCENLAMPGLVVSMLIRHLDSAGDLLDPYFADPIVWSFEFSRVVKEGSIIASNSEGVKNRDRRTWTLKNAAMTMALGADDDRAAELKTIGEALIEKARHIVDHLPSNRASIDSDELDEELAKVMLWASCLDRDKFQVHQTAEGMYIQPTPPDEVVQTLHEGNQDFARASEATRLTVRYLIKANEVHAGAIEPDELTADLLSAKALLEEPPTLGGDRTWDVPTLVAAAVLDAHLSRGVDLPVDSLVSAAEVVLTVSKGAASPGLYDYEESYFEQGADRSAARTLPLLLTPAADSLRALVDGGDGSAAFDRILVGGMHLAKAMVNEVRLHMARGLDHLWATPCVREGLCHHQLGWGIVIETMRDCVVGGWDRETGTRQVIALEEPMAESLRNTPDEAIQPFRLDAAIRALAPATVANICISTDARELLSAVLDAQKRSSVHDDQHHFDDRGTHALETARAVLTLAQNGDEASVYAQIDAYADSPSHLGNLLRGLSASAEETQDRAATALRIWPSVMLYVLALADAGHTPFEGDFVGDMTLAALLPVRTSEWEYLYRELQAEPLNWWDPLAVQSEVEAWLVYANGNATCVDQLVSFLGEITLEDQARLGLPWMAQLLLAKPGNIAKRTYLLPNWLIETRTTADAVGLANIWQQIVDALVVEGDSRLARYSE